MALYHLQLVSPANLETFNDGRRSADGVKESDSVTYYGDCTAAGNHQGCGTCGDDQSWTDHQVPDRTGDYEGRAPCFNFDQADHHQGLATSCFDKRRLFGDHKGRDPGFDKHCREQDDRGYRMDRDFV
jgi:hypothetical protein